MTSLVALMFASTPADAQALSWVFQPGAVFSPDPAISYMSESIGAPTVFWDAGRSRFVMIFEARTPNVDPSCPAGIWALGIATSPDGYVWTPLDANRATAGVVDPVLMPDPAGTTFYRCVAAHPTVSYEPTAGPGGNGQARIWFKAMQGTNPTVCPGTPPSWGCNDGVGIGRVNVNFNAAGNVLSVVVPTATPRWTAAAGATFGFPKIVKDAGTYRILWQIYPDIYGKFFTVPGALLTNPTIQMRLSDAITVLSWAQNELFNPTLLCDDSATYSGATWLGAKDTNGANTVVAAWSKTLFDTGTNTWLYDTVAQQTWNNSNEFRHWDSHKLSEAVHGPNSYVMWFSEKDAVTGNAFIRLGGTTLTFAGTDLVSKTCP